MRQQLVLLARRGLAQARLLAAVLAVVVAGTVVLGTCVLLLTTGADRAREAHLRQTPAGDLAAEVAIGEVPVDARGAVDAATGVLTDALGPLPATVSTWASSTVRGFGTGANGRPQLAYLAGISDLPARAELLTGRWPAASGGPGPLEGVLPARAAELLGVGPGAELTLAAGESAPGTAVTVLVVGTYAPHLADPAWQRDLLGGAGYTAALDFGVWRTSTRPAYGPLLVDSAALLAQPGGLDQVRVVAHPDLTGASAADLDAAAAGLDAARTALPEALTGQDATSRVDAPLARTLAAVRTQQGVTGSAVLVVALVGLALAGTALGLSARLLTGRRTAEAALLTARGAGRRQLAGRAAAEAGALAVLATALAVPLSALLFRGLTSLPRPAAAGVTGPLAVTWPLVAAVAGGAVALTAVLVAPALGPVAGGAAVRRSRRGVVARSGVDLLLAGVAALVLLQLRAHPGASADAVDPLLVAAPVLGLLAAAVLALRVLPLLQAGAERWARRSRGLVGSLAAWEVARRPHATGAALLLVLATAAATFATGYADTWSTSQVSQAAARVGADVTVPATVPAPLTQGDAVAAVLGGTVSPATERPVSLGSLSATGTLPPTTRLVAVDTSVADDLLVGDLPDGGRWSALTAGLGAPGRAPGVPLVVPDTGPAVTVTGTGADGVLGVRPVLVVQDAQGARSTLTGAELPLDGTTHPVVLRDAADATPGPGTRLTVVGVDLQLSLRDPSAVDPAAARGVAVSVQLQLAGGPPDGTAATWTARPPLGSSPGLLDRAGVDLTAGAQDTTFAVRGQVSPAGLLVEQAQLLLTAYPPPPAVPVLLTADLAAAIDARPGDGITLGVGARTVPGRVAGVTPWLPGAPGEPGVLADVEVLARALETTGDLDPLVDSWWATGVADPATAAGRLADAGLPGAVTRAGVAAQLRDGPLRVGLPVVLWLLTAAAVGLALTGTAVHVAAVLESRSVEVARLQGMGVPRRSVAAAVVLEHASVTSVAVLLGAVVGAVAGRVLAPLMTVSETGGVPVPAPVAQWPWPTESVLVAGLLLGCAAVVVPVAGTLVRRAATVHLRLGDAA
ncbi:permease [Modestobacter muralis]|uniref:Permease n=1 Tax=Modestobacter muralis TaxID=1608614 RepID=A0A6P0ESA9_9ACTN|nr:permease [Modestobacter muralis]NEK93646.1 permease [Modestobacter muralis]NEN50413.1 permease [Modestobacter muralis]